MEISAEIGSNGNRRLPVIMVINSAGCWSEALGISCNDGPECEQISSHPPDAVFMSPRCRKPAPTLRVNILFPVRAPDPAH